MSSPFVETNRRIIEAFENPNPPLGAPRDSSAFGTNGS